MDLPFESTCMDVKFNSYQKFSNNKSDIIIGTKTGEILNIEYNKAEKSFTNKNIIKTPCQNITDVKYIDENINVNQLLFIDCIFIEERLFIII